MGVGVRGESGLVVRGEDVAEPYLVASWCDTMNLTKKWQEKIFLKLKKLDSPYYNLPVHTHDTVVQVRGMPRCVKIHYHTRTCKTHDLKPVGFPVPVTIPTYQVMKYDPYSQMVLD
jgi:hypothetical protein